jgi:hypothetical protein
MGRSSNESGASIVQVMMAAVFLTALVAAGNRYMSSQFKSSRKLESSLDLSGIKARVVDSVNCTKTLASQPNCTTSLSYISLKDDADREIIAADGSTRIGPFTVRARCNPGATGGIEVRAARLTPVGQASETAKGFGATAKQFFVRDEVADNLSYDWEHPKGLLFSGPAPGMPAESRLCREFFLGTTADGIERCKNPADVMVGFNTLTQTVVCEPVSPLVSSTIECRAGEYMYGMVNGVPRCRKDVGGDSSPPSGPGGMTWNSTGSLDGKLKHNSRTDNWFCDNKSHPYCPDVRLPGASCSVKNRLCTHNPHKKSTHGCRVYRCY